MPGLTGSYYSSLGAVFEGDPHFRITFLRWKIYCMIWGRIAWPVAYVIKDRDVIIHYSFILPSIGRINGMSNGDIEIGPCWTSPSFRRRGIFRTAIRNILADYWAPDRVVWMLCRMDNSPSNSGILASSFIHVAQCDRHQRIGGVPIHLFSPVATNIHVDALESPLQAASVAIERLRYNQQSRIFLNKGHCIRLKATGAAGTPVALRSPYDHYHQELSRLAGPGTKVLDLCCGDGLHSVTAALRGAHVVGLDVAEESLKAAEERARLAGTAIQTVHASADKLPFPDHSFDVVTCAGGLSYVEFANLLSEVTRVLRPGGTLLCVDSFDENLIYRANRWLQFLRGTRTRQTLTRIPNRRTLNQVRAVFGSVQVEYYGILSFSLPLLKWFLSENLQRRFLDRTDRALRIFRHYSFKIVLRAQAPRQAVIVGR